MSEQDKLKDFAWDDIEEESSDTVSWSCSQEEIEKCADLIIDYVMEHLSSDHFEGGGCGGKVYEGIFKLAVPIKRELHPILENRFEEKWTLDSRLEVFESLQDRFEDQFRKKQESFNALVNDMLPASSRKKLEIDAVHLFDDAVTVIGQEKEADTLSVEILLHFVVNP